MSTERRLRLIEVTIATGMSASFYKISFHLRISGMSFPSDPFHHGCFNGKANRMRSENFENAEKQEPAPSPGESNNPKKTLAKRAKTKLRSQRNDYV